MTLCEVANNILKNEYSILLENTKSVEYIVKLFDTKQIDKDWSFEEFKPSDTGKWTHNYHRYPAKFIPQLGLT